MWGPSRMSSYRLLGFSGAILLLVLVGGTLIGGVSASPSAPTAAMTATSLPAASAPAAAGVYCQAYRAALAANLGTTEAALAEASRKAAATTIDQAVADGKLTTAAADRLKARLTDASDDGCQRLAVRLDRVKPAIGVARDALTAAADALTMRPAELRAQLRGGASLKTIAGSKGVEYATVTAAVLAAVKADLDAAVMAGTIPQARADKVLDRLEARLADGRLRPTD
jgi:ribosomal protein S20